MKRNSAFWGVVVVALAGALAVGISFTTEAEAVRFVDNQDGTITDNQTELMWEKKMPGGSGQNCVENLHGVKALCDWNTAMSEWLSRVNGLSDEADGSDQKGLGVLHRLAVADAGGVEKPLGFKCRELRWK